MIVDEEPLWDYDKFIDQLTILVRGMVKAQGKVSIPEIVDVILILVREHPEINGLLWARGIETTNGHKDFEGMSIETICDDFDLNFDLDEKRVVAFVNIGRRVAVDELMENLPELDETEIEGKPYLISC